MKKVNFLAKTLVAIAAIGLCFPSAAMSATPVTKQKVVEKKPQVVDVALLKGNVLVGQLVTPEGKGVSNAPLLLQNKDKTVVALRTDKNGVFAAKSIPAGVYRVAGTNTQGVYRFWAPKTAPPNAQRGALLVSGNGVARAQYARGLRNMLANPWIVAGIVACAVAIPVAIHNSQSSSPASP